MLTYVAQLRAQFRIAQTHADRARSQRSRRDHGGLPAFPPREPQAQASKASPNCGARSIRTRSCRRRAEAQITLSIRGSRRLRAFEAQSPLRLILRSLTKERAECLVAWVIGRDRRASCYWQRPFLFF